MLWAACCLGFFGFLRAGEFTVNSPFNPDIHLAVSDVHADSLVNPGSFRIHIKCSKTDPFHQGCYIYIGAGKRDLCPVCTLTQYLHARGSTSGPLFLLSDGTPLHRQWLTSSIQSTVQLRYKRTTHTRIIRAYFAYTRMSIRAHIRVYTHTYTRIYAYIRAYMSLCYAFP